MKKLSSKKIRSTLRSHSGEIQFNQKRQTQLMSKKSNTKKEKQKRTKQIQSNVIIKVVINKIHLEDYLYVLKNYGMKL